MSEETTSSEPVTGPVVAAPPQHVHEEPRRSRLTAAASWVGIVAGVVFVVAVIFFSGFVLGKNTGGHPWGGHHRGGPQGDVAIFHRGGPPPMFPMGPRGEFERPGPGFAPPFGPGGPGQPGEPTTTAPARP